MFKAHNNTQPQIQIKPSLKNGFEYSLRSRSMLTERGLKHIKLLTYSPKKYK